MLADIVIKIVEKLFDSAMQKRDDDNIKLFEQNRMLRNRARLTATDKLVIGYIEKHAPLAFDKLLNEFPSIDCMGKRVAMLNAFGFTAIQNHIITITDEYREIADDLSLDYHDNTIVQHKTEV